MITEHLDTLISRYPSLSICRDSIFAAYSILEESFASGGKLLLCGNGGSASDCEHIAGELMKGFKMPRTLSGEAKVAFEKLDAHAGSSVAQALQGALPCIALSGHPALSTAFANDRDPLMVFAQQVWGYGAKGDTLLAISTSGSSRNVYYAALAAKVKGMKIIALTGARGGSLSSIADATIAVPEEETYRAQELHLPVYHCLCLMLEERFFSVV